MHPTARDAVAILDYGSQYSQLIARRVREASVYCELLPHDVTPERFAALNPRGVILSGGPASVYDPGAPVFVTNGTLIEPRDQGYASQLTGGTQVSAGEGTGPD